MQIRAEIEVGAAKWGCCSSSVHLWGCAKHPMARGAREVTESVPGEPVRFSPRWLQAAEFPCSLGRMSFVPLDSDPRVSVERLQLSWVCSSVVQYLTWKNQDVDLHSVFSLKLSV